ncbi:hypothetical protein AUEXF2481DRAFT_4697 [Aureobasidium subglaciale EXF-2481]|uniref:Borealin N-terminal domain-containing protein n=1 Tax=Aureobasidium subglaciale (strain EXF-2481) TaxID=1043005 RepID=A0A074YD68_AURSE|nr:uncharacterized protein AUEXF2481DRAFT_4697 [Aureobasidium subglaciale EXF-2481]KAI5196937.1 hypothetical protein E4T38_08229 [Aureobasidium subglaciale]KAI5215686.1 hypothetical protein E4T40_08239 [Aureobasidium subglaciale]KAI5218908.1 hypothetical protein E4T41_08154 [Aureobasidium subglaciale]KAI5256527.1 hypothetical protein E4T46_08130 [Aureobasidium subglaciale]KEQ95738.1 hypothetical protein AUEXF2481DRAFT_4697 [Aureobasidium subglaciale EXF-2481]
MTSLVATPDATMASERVAHISEAQKQALMDNLQLEVADRARKLRAQYTLQAQGLRTRLEMRINRIPRHLRKANMGDLLEKHLDAQKKTQQRLPSPIKTKSLKRKSEEASMANKENTQPASAALANPKKRSKPSPGPTGIPTSPNLARSVRPQPLNTAILSPKSPNSRTLPRSPLKSPTTKSPPPLPRPRGAAPLQGIQSTKKGTIKRPATAPTSTTLDAITSAAQPNTSTRRALRASNASAESTSSEKTTIVHKSPAKPNPPSRPHTAMALASPSKKLPVPSSPTKYNSIREKPLPVPSVAPTPVAGTTKKGTFKSAMASLTGSKRGKKTTAAATFGTNATPPPAGRVLRKRAP